MNNNYQNSNTNNLFIAGDIEGAELIRSMQIRSPFYSEPENSDLYDLGSLETNRVKPAEEMAIKQYESYIFELSQIDDEKLVKLFNSAFEAGVYKKLGGMISTLCRIGGIFRASEAFIDEIELEDLKHIANLEQIISRFEKLTKPIYERDPSLLKSAMKRFYKEEIVRARTDSSLPKLELIITRISSLLLDFKFESGLKNSWDNLVQSLSEYGLATQKSRLACMLFDLRRS